MIGLRAMVAMIAARRLLGLRRPRPGAAAAAPARRPLGADGDADLPPGPGRRRRRGAPARGGGAARAGGGAGRPRALWHAACSPARWTAPSTSRRRWSCAAMGSSRAPDAAVAQDAHGTTFASTLVGAAVIVASVAREAGRRGRLRGLSRGRDSGAGGAIARPGSVARRRRAGSGSRPAHGARRRAVPELAAPPQHRATRSASRRSATATRAPRDRR